MSAYAEGLEALLLLLWGMHTAHVLYRLAVPNQPPSRSADLCPHSQPQVSAHGTGAQIPPVDEQARALLVACEPTGFQLVSCPGFCCLLLRAALPLACVLAAVSQPVCHTTPMCLQVVAMKLVTPALGTIELSKVGVSVIAWVQMGATLVSKSAMHTLLRLPSAACCPALYSL